MKIVRALLTGLIYFCVATIICQVIGGAMLFGKGFINQEKMVNVLAAIYGLDVAEMKAKIDEANRDDADIQIAYDRVLQNRVLASLDIDLRESAIEKSMGELRNLQNDVVVQRQRHEQVRQTFEVRLKELESNAANLATQKVLQTMEQMHPKQAKDQLMRIVEEGEITDAVAIINAMKPDKLKKIIQEFKSGEEGAKLYNILREIRSGRGQMELLERTRSQLDNAGGNG